MCRIFSFLHFLRYLLRGLHQIKIIVQDVVLGLALCPVQGATRPESAHTADKLKNLSMGDGGADCNLEEAQKPAIFIGMCHT